MSVDTEQALRLVLCLANPSRMQAARWGEARLDSNQALRLVSSPTNPSELRSEEVPVGPGASWIPANAFFGKPQHRRASQTENTS